jgi:hypothetical protein
MRQSHYGEDRSSNLIEPHLPISSRGRAHSIRAAQRSSLTGATPQATGYRTRGSRGARSRPLQRKAGRHLRAIDRFPEKW